MNVTEIAKLAAESGEEPDWGRVMSQIPKVVKLILDDTDLKVLASINTDHK